MSLKMTWEIAHVVIDERDFIIAHQPIQLDFCWGRNLQFHDIGFDSPFRRTSTQVSLIEADESKVATSSFGLLFLSHVLSTAKMKLAGLSNDQLKVSIATAWFADLRPSSAAAASWSGTGPFRTSRTLVCLGKFVLRIGETGDISTRVGIGGLLPDLTGSLRSDSESLCPPDYVSDANHVFITSKYIFRVSN